MSSLVFVIVNVIVTACGISASLVFVIVDVIVVVDVIVIVDVIVTACGTSSLTQQKMRIYAKKVNRMLVITEDLISRYQDDDGITYMNIYEFLLNEDCL